MRNIPKLIYRQLYCYFCADRIIGKYPQLKAEDHRVNLFDYHPELENDNRYNNNRYNLGDYLGFVVVDYMLSQSGNLSLDTWIPKRKHLNAVGSNIFSSYQRTTVWGSGIHHNPYTILRFLQYYPLRHLDIRAVRGPLSREVLLRYGHKCPEIYGDPAILMPLIYQPKVAKTDKTLVIPQYVTEKDFRAEHPDLIMESMNTKDYKKVIDAIASSKKVITSSLHAVILADAYGVPSVLFRGLGKKVDFKYLDYYASTGRIDVHIADSFDEACKMEPLPVPNLKLLQEGLMNTFPYDLWEQ